MKNKIYVWKPVGLTPLELVNKFKEKNQRYSREKISYAGRLDPMAEGILVLLIGEENKKRDKYLELKKTYESEFIIGISTDSFDALGIIGKVNSDNASEENIKAELTKFIGKQKQVYPPYSSKAVNGKTLFWWARNNKLSEIKMPVRAIEVYSAKILDIDHIKGGDLSKIIIENIKKVDGDFRQKEIIKNWEDFEILNKEISFMKIKIEISCSSGTYIRRIASDLGEKLETGAFALTIKRTTIGNVTQEECFKI